MGRIKELSDYYFLNAESKDMSANAITGKYLANDLINRKGKIKFGNIFETFSAVLGKIRKARQESKIEKIISDNLDKIQKDHVENAAENDIIKN